MATLAGFLESKTEPDFVANVHLDPATPQQIEHGKRLVVENGCASCHEINGIKKPENFAPELSRIGSKPMSQLLFVEGVEHSLPDYVAAKVRNPRAFGPSLKMPQFKLTPQQIDAVTTALLALTDRAQTQPPTMRIASVQQTKYEPAGHAGQLMHDLRCFTCHMINGHGGDMAPDLTWEGTAVQREWLTQFLKNPETLRPALIRRMPKFNLTDAEINTLADYMMTVYQTPEFDRDSLPVSQFTPARSNRDGSSSTPSLPASPATSPTYKTDKGYIGPALAGDGQALQCSLGLSLAEGSAGAASRNHRAQPAHDRRRSALADRVPDVAQVRRRAGGGEEMKPALIAVCARHAADGGMLAQEQAACASASHRHRSCDRRVQRRQADWLYRNAAGSTGRGAGERRLRKWCRRSGGLFQRAIRREFYASRSADRLQRAGHQPPSRSASRRAGTSSSPARAMPRGRASSLTIDEIALGLPANRRSAAQRAVLRPLSRPGVHAAAGLEHGQPVGQATSLHRRRHAQQNERCRLGRHHQPRRCGIEQIAARCRLGDTRFPRAT